uniref:Uncharacterized protein n=1 Tax=Otus sunia TaxID=257818 RepID=A0A8C8AM62_9STRI
GAGDSPSPPPAVLAASSRFVLWKSPDFPLLPAVLLCPAEDNGSFSHSPSPQILPGWDGAALPPGPPVSMLETPALLDVRAGIRAGMRLRRRTRCWSLPCWGWPEGNLSVQLSAELWFWSAHEPLSSQRLIWLQIRQALGFPGSDEPMAVPGQARGGFLQLSILPLPPSPLALQPFLLWLPSPRAGT